MAGNTADSQKVWLQAFLSAQKAPVFYAVGGCTEEGWLGVANGNQHPAKLFVVSGVLPASILAGVALPAIAKARAAKNQQ